MDGKIQEMLLSVGVKTPRIDVDKWAVMDRQSPSGVLKKFIIELESQKFYVKSGEITNRVEFSYLFPISEVIAYEIGSLLNLPMCKYELWEISALNFLEQEDFDIYKKYLKLTDCGSLDHYLISNGTIIVCASPSFVDKNIEDFHTCLAVHSNEVVGKVLYEELCNSGIFTRSFIDRMILLDYLINNTDRHKSNFGVIYKDGQYREAPFFDHGQSLLSRFPNEFLEEYGTDCFGEFPLKPFQSSSAIEWVTRDSFTDVVLDLDTEDFNLIVHKYAPLLGSETRVSLMKRLLEVRWKHVKKVLSEI